MVEAGKSKAMEAARNLRSNLCRELMEREGISAPVPPSFLAMAKTALDLLNIIELIIIENAEREE
ncbi:hypothetical protein LCGC14_0338640 [marine sediment metagenome]|uniref:Uncharacterized protein n=1 Tax=marine sediment metagenome TaxID=412755 RepID=A0A0F9TEM0_9ZZZZ